MKGPTMSTDPALLAGPWDVVVVGHGAAGLSAAASFLESFRGAAPRVAVLDRAPKEQRGGSTAWTTAAFRLDDDLQLSEDWGEIVRRTAGDAVNDGYIHTFYEEAVETLNWIRRHGVAVRTVRNAALPGTFSRHINALEGGGRAFVDTFGDLVVAGGAQCFYETELLGLDREPEGPITGVRVRSADGSEHTMVTSAVVLACGGFEGDAEEFGRRVPGGESVGTVSSGTRVNTGAGIRAATAIGAAKAGQYDGSHLEPTDPRAVDATEPLVVSWFWGMLVDPAGERFIDEAGAQIDLQFDYVAKAVLARGGLAYAVSDASVQAGAPRPFNQVNSTPVGSIKADSIRELAEKIGVDADALERTVASYNAASVDTPYDGTVMDHKHTVGITPPKSHFAQPLTEAPFEAWPVSAQICFTFEGLRVDDTTHVLDTDGRRIPGLHAAGEIVGTFYGDTYPAGSSVLRSLTFGRLAGLEVAEAVRRAPDTVVGA